MDRGERCPWSFGGEFDAMSLDDGMAVPENIVRMNVSEGQHELQPYGEQRKPPA
jgi:hypothetical protein